MIATFNDGLSLVHLLLDRMRECRPSGPRQQRHLDMRDNRKRPPQGPSSDCACLARTAVGPNHVHAVRAWGEAAIVLRSHNYIQAAGSANRRVLRSVQHPQSMSEAYAFVDAKQFAARLALVDPSVIQAQDRTRNALVNIAEAEAMISSYPQLHELLAVTARRRAEVEIAKLASSFDRAKPFLGRGVDRELAEGRGLNDSLRSGSWPLSWSLTEASLALLLRDRDYLLTALGSFVHRYRAEPWYPNLGADYNDIVERATRAKRSDQHALLSRDEVEELPAVERSTVWTTSLTPGAGAPPRCLAGRLKAPVVRRLAGRVVGQLSFEGR